MRPVCICACGTVHGGLLEPLRVDVASSLFGLVGRLAGFDLVAGRVPDLPNLGHSKF